MFQDLSIQVSANPGAHHTGGGRRRLTLGGQNH